MAQSYAEKQKAVRTMISGLRAHSDRMEKRGLSKDFVAKMEELANQMVTLETEQEGLKARLKEKTVSLDNVVEEMGVMVAEARKMVKVEIGQETWVEFGIDAKR